VPDVIIPKSFKKRLGKKTPEMQGAILKTIDKLAVNPRSPGLHTHKLPSHGKGVFDAYVDGSNRVTWRWEDSAIMLLNHCNHSIVNK
jgi:hypothetical protein